MYALNRCAQQRLLALGSRRSSSSSAFHPRSCTSKTVRHPSKETHVFRIVRSQQAPFGSSTKSQEQLDQRSSLHNFKKQTEKMGKSMVLVVGWALELSCCVLNLRSLLVHFDIHFWPYLTLSLLTLADEVDICWPTLRNLTLTSM